MTYGELLRDLRISAGLTLGDVAHAAGVSVIQASDAERGNLVFDDDVTRRVADALGIVDATSLLRAADRMRSEKATSDPLPYALHAILERATEAKIPAPWLTLRLQGERGDELEVTLFTTTPKGIDWPVASATVNAGATWSPVVTTMYHAIRVVELALAKAAREPAPAESAG